jgi:PAS domain S-box-containing protein
MIATNLNFKDQPRSAKWLRVLTVLVIVLVWSQCLNQFIENLSSDAHFAVGTMIGYFLFACFVTFVLAIFYLKLHALIMEHANERMILFKMSPYPMWIYDLETLKFLKVNDAACSLYGFKEEEFLSMRISDIRPDEDVPVLINAVDRIKLNFNHRYHWSGTWRHKKKNGNLMYVEISSHEITFDGKKTELVLAYDVSDRILRDQKLQALNQELERSVMSRTNDLLNLNKKLVDQNRAIKSANLELFTISNQLQEANLKAQEHADLKSRFVEMASHEFRTPMASIAFSAGFLRRHMNRLEPQNMVDKLQGIEKHVDQMAAMLEDVLTIERNHPVKVEVRNQSVDLPDFMRQLAAEVQAANNNSHAIVLNVHERVTRHLNTDENVLRNIFINLLGNAIKYSPDRDKVRVNIYQMEDKVCVDVVDEGVGISKTEVEKIFEPFYRGDASQNITGIGLGLSIVRRAVDLLEGSVEVCSEIGEGSTFKVMLPVK